MRMVGHGIDAVRVQVIRNSIDAGDRWCERVYSKDERAQADPPPREARYYAGRFAGKEAVVKALGTGFRGQMTWRGVEILRGESGQPHVRLSNEVLAQAAELGVTEWLISISHCGEISLASAIALGP